ncbi:MAG TPA: hydrogenase maturation nickel metallochaperone HypA [Thermoanaerobaculia bacterium]|nr:hydrogenase maturation nickel metallochaperone HypA [Thermoanaerobaculia bacterium]
MHELAITQQIVDLVAERAGRGRVRRVVVEIGRLTAVLPDAVRSCFDLCAEGTAVAGAELEVVETPGRARCRACGETLTLDRPFGWCRCGGSDLDWLGGDELKITRIEVT